VKRGKREGVSASVSEIEESWEELFKEFQIIRALCAKPTVWARAGALSSAYGPPRANFSPAL
jgi:predicted ATP-grasp superfamily ATP-dependent carboligase